jgi:hypothetical protein
MLGGESSAKVRVGDHTTETSEFARVWLDQRSLETHFGPLFVSQRNHGIDARRSPGWNIGSKHCDQEEEDRDTGE